MFAGNTGAVGSDRGYVIEVIAPAKRGRDLIESGAGVIDDVGRNRRRIAIELNPSASLGDCVGLERIPGAKI